MSGHAIQQRANDVVLQYRAELDFVLALDDVKERRAARNLNVLDANVLVHCDQHCAQCTINLRAILEAQQMVQVVEHFGEHFVAILIHDGRQQDLIFIGVAGNRESWNIVTTTG